MPSLDAGVATVCYESEIVRVGSLVKGFVADHGILVFFGEHAPAELQDISVLHRPVVELAGPAPGDIVEIGDRAIPVLAVGSVVERNLLDLGHIDFKANGKSAADLPGDVCVPVDSLPQPAVGSSFRITRPGPPETPSPETPSPQTPTSEPPSIVAAIPGGAT